MRKPEYLSPSSIKQWTEDKEMYYTRYLSDIRVPRDPQTQPMSIGSAFDAYTKSHLHSVLFGTGHDPRFELQALFEAQVEPHNRDWAWEHGKVCFIKYRDSGALADLLIELRGALGTPQFEIEVKGTVTANMAGVTFLGKPDVYFRNKEGIPVIYDWKVNGWCSKSNISPKPGYIRLRHGSLDRSKDKGAHKDASLNRVQGMLINTAHPLESVEKDWAQQLAIYGWVCGMDVGSEFIVGIDQIACKPEGIYPDIRIAQHRCIVSPTYQWAVFGNACALWNAIQTGHIFTDMTKEENDARCDALDGKGRMTNELAASDNESDRLFSTL